MKFFISKAACILAAAALATACSDEPKGNEDDNRYTPGVVDGIKGFYVLNEGNMGSNKCTLDYYDYATGTYERDIYARANPGKVMELGDTGNDMALYNGRLYIVVNGSHKVEVLEAATAKSLGQVDIASPRYIAFSGNNAYVTSFVGGNDGRGSVVRFDTGTLATTGTVEVGFQPEEMAVDGTLLYAANSGQLAPEYDNTLSVIDLNSFTFKTSVTVDINMHHVRLDRWGHMWVSSRGNYADVAPNLYRLTKGGDGLYGSPKATGTLCSNLTLADEYIYYYGTEYDADWNPTVSYGKLGPISGNSYAQCGEFITDGTASQIKAPYCVAVHPGTGDILITDARNYVSSGELYCYGADGKQKWHIATGDIPGHITFVK